MVASRQSWATLSLSYMLQLSFISMYRQVKEHLFCFCIVFYLFVGVVVVCCLLFVCLFVLSNLIAPVYLLMDMFALPFLF